MPNIVRGVPPLDDTDRVILTALVEDGRTPNNALAERAGIAPSTCLTRVRTLRERGVIRGVHADVDPAAVGRETQAVVLVDLRENARGHVEAFKASIADVPGVVASFYLAGPHDYLLHVARRAARPAPRADRRAPRRPVDADPPGAGARPGAGAAVRHRTSRLRPGTVP